jgi:hypothetical protein
MKNQSFNNKNRNFGDSSISYLEYEEVEADQDQREYV